MANSIGGNGGVNSSSLDHLLSQLGEILNKQSEINATKVKPKADDSELKPIRKSLEAIREEIEETGSANIDFLNTKTIKKSVSDALSELEKIKKSTKGFEDDIKNIDVAKSFINNYKLLEEYGKRFGKDFVGEYKRIFKEITEEGSHIDLGFDISGLKTSEIDKLFDDFQQKIKDITERASKSANSTVNMEVSYAKDDYYNDLAKERKRAYDEERQAAIETTNAVKEAERQKQEALIETREELVKGVKTQLEDLKSSSSDGKFLEIDYDQWGKFQKNAGDMIQTLNEMGVETRDLEDLLGSISKKVYIPKDQFDAVKKGFDSKDLTSFLNVLERIEEQLRNISSTLGTVDENSGFNNMISSIDILLSKLDEMHKKIGTGVYNISVNQGSDETTFAQDESIKSYIRDTRNRYQSAYDKVIQKAGGEELLFARINNVLNTGIDQLNEAYSSINIGQIESKEEQVYRLMNFFKVLRQAMSDEDFGLDLSGVRLPSSNDENFRKNIRDKSGETERRKQQRVKDELLRDEPEESLPGLNQITQALERIESLITEISQKDLFGDSLLNVSEQLDKIVSKFDELASTIHTINDERGLTSNQTSLSSNEKEIEKATTAIEEEGNAAKKSAEQKEEFVLANQKVAESWIETADGIKKATDAIKEEGKAVSENKIDTSQFESTIKISDTLRDRLGGVLDVYKQIQKDSDGQDKISYRLVGKNGSAWVGANGDILKEQIKTSEELTQQKKEEKEVEKEISQIIKENAKYEAERAKEIAKANEERKRGQEQARQEAYSDMLKEVYAEADKTLEYERERTEQIKIAEAEKIKGEKQAAEIAKQEQNNREAYIKFWTSALNQKDLSQRQGDDTAKYKSLLIQRQSVQGDLDAAIIKNDQNAIKYSQERIAQLDKEMQKLEQLGNVNKKTAEESVEAEMAKIKASEKASKANDSQAKREASNLNRQSKMVKDFSLWLSKNGAAAKEYANEVTSIFEQLRNQGNLTAEQLNKVQQEINHLMATAAHEGKTGSTFLQTVEQRFKSLGAYLATFASFYDIVRYVREAINTIREYDTALTEMRKVSDESLSSLKQYASTTFDIGDAVGATALTIQNSTADWLRLGEAIEDAQESAKASNILLNVSEFENIEDATTSLVAMSQAYRDIDKMDIIDKLNNVGNNFSISTDKLAIGLQDAAAVLQTQGNSIDESIALITAANSQVQDISKASGGIRTISLRISGTEEAKAELEDLGEDVEDYIVQTSSKTQETIKNFTAVASNMGKGIDVLDANGNLRNTYDILLDISKIYKEIQEEDKKAGTNRANALVEFIAGKNRSNIAASILNAPDLLENVYKASQNSEDSAQAELDKYLDSLEGKITQTTNHLQELANVTINSDSIKTLIDLLNVVLSIATEIVDIFGAIPIALTGTGIAAFVKNLDQPTYMVA